MKRIVVSSIQVMLSKDDVIDNPELMGMWVKQNLGMRSKMEGCALAKQNFGNGSPFSNTKIEKLECMKEFKDKRRQASGIKGAMRHWSNEPTKKQILSRIAKLPKSKLISIVDHAEDSSRMFSETLVSLSKEY